MSETSDVARFLYEEAELLDQGDYDAWFALFTDDARYWVPSHPQQTDPHVEISLFYEDRALMHARIGRLRHARALDTPIRTSHVIGNVRLDERTPGSALVARSRFQMLEFVADEQRIHGGAVTHHLVAAKDGWRIRLKRVDLVNAGGVFDLLQVFF
jgi:3-phenylpropionate/cinnamic acid dioxygenase small subunit